MKKCTLNMWLHSPDEECPYFEKRLDELDDDCEYCKWFEEE